MGRIEGEDLQDPERIYIAPSLRLAKQVEEWLTMTGVSYAVQVEPFARSVLFGTLRMGAAFYVTSGQAAYCRERLIAAGLGRGVVEQDEQELEEAEEEQP
jgi:hypothetical protein